MTKTRWLCLIHSLNCFVPTQQLEFPVVVDGHSYLVSFTRRDEPSEVARLFGERFLLPQQNRALIAEMIRTTQNQHDLVRTAASNILNCHVYPPAPQQRSSPLPVARVLDPVGLDAEHSFDHDLIWRQAMKGATLAIDEHRDRYHKNEQGQPKQQNAADQNDLARANAV